MTKNYVQDGKTIPVRNFLDKTMKSGELVFVGKVAAMVIADIPPGHTGDGFAEGVFLLPKIKTDRFYAGQIVALAEGNITLAGVNQMPVVGTVWENSLDGQTLAPVKLNAVTELTRELADNV